jgi:short-subunit dehydrogenase
VTTALITGGARGIGLALSAKLLAEGFGLLWVDRSEELLRAGREQLQASRGSVPRLQTLVCDLAEPQAAEQVFAWSQAEREPVALLVNNAGLGAYGLLTEIPLPRDLAVLNVNVLTLHRLTRLFLADMQRRDAGTIVNIASVTAILPSPAFALYSATKAFVRQYTRCLDMELRATGSQVRAITVCPAAVRGTGFQREAGMERTGFFRGPTVTTAEEVASDIWPALRDDRRSVLTGRGLRWLLPLVRLLPTRLMLGHYRRQLQAAFGERFLS